MSPIPYDIQLHYCIIHYNWILFFLLDGVFCCYVFRAVSKEKAYALSLSVTKAFYLACQILQEEQGLFPPTPNRETLFEPQKDDDTKVLGYPVND